MASATRTIRVRFDGNAKGLIAAAAKAGIAVDGFEKQVKKSAAATSVSVGSGLIDALGSLPSVLKGAAIVAAAGIGVVMAPALASAIISGVLLAVGGGVLVAGIVGAAKSPKVIKAWQRLGTQAAVMFERFSKPFIKPLERAARTFSQALARSGATILRIGSVVAPVIDKLAPAIGGLVENALPGILAAAEASVLLFDVLAANLPGIGGSLALFFQTLAAGAPVAAQFFDRFLKWIQDILPKAGEFLVWLQNLGVKMDAIAKGPELAGLKSALIDLKDNVLVGIKVILDSIKTSLTENSATWVKLGKDVEGAIRLIGPAVKWVAEQVAVNVDASITGFAAFYEAIRRVVQILVKAGEVVDALRRGLDRLPGNLSGGNTHVQLGTIERRAYGGPAIAGRSYVVGDGGEPEIFTPGATGFITPMSKATGASSSSSAPIIVENHIEIGGEVVRVVRTEIRESDRRLKRAVLAGAGAR